MAKSVNTPDAEPASAAPKEVSKDAARADFARRLRRRMNEMGLSQSDLSREASKNMASGKDIGRDSVSQYLNGLSLPTDERLFAIAKALKMAPEELLPSRGVKIARTRTPSPIELQKTDAGFLLRINQEVSNETGLKILELLNKDPLVKA